MDLYAERNIVERFFCKIKKFRRVATRYDKLSRNFLSSIYLTVIRYFLKGKNLIESTP